MDLSKFVFVVALALGSALVVDVPKGDTLVDWAKLKNPILSYSKQAIKDVYVQYDGVGTFYMFFSSFETRTDGVFRCSVVEVATKDFKTYSTPILNIDGTSEGWIGMASPSVTPLKINATSTKYILTFNSWGDKTGKPDSLFYLESYDLVHWNQDVLKPLGTEVTGGIRAIDADLAISFVNGSIRYYLMWKEIQTQKIAVSDNLDSGWKKIGGGTPSFKLTNGTESHCENYNMLKIVDTWYTLCSLLGLKGYEKNLYLYEMSKSGVEDMDWLDWIHGYSVDTAIGPWNDKGPNNAGALSDWSKYDGWIYAFYAGENVTRTFHNRGHETIGVSRTKNLKDWYPAGTQQQF